jgi:transposase
MSGKRYTEEFKVEAIKQITERGRPVAEVASRLGVTSHSLYQWLKTYSAAAPERQAVQDQQSEIRRLKAELKRVTEERDILKKAAAYFARTSG